MRGADSPPLWPINPVLHEICASAPGHPRPSLRNQVQHNTQTNMDLDPRWKFAADTVMGGVSQGHMSHELFHGRMATVLRGDVSLANNGGFVQINFDLCPDGGCFDASAWDGVAFDLWGNGESYDIRLRTDQLTRPWQSFRSEISTNGTWQTLHVPFATLTAHKTDVTFDRARLRRIGIVAIGRVFHAEVAIARTRLYH